MLQRVTAYVLEPQDGILHGREGARHLRDQIVVRLESLPADIVMPIDFVNVRFIDFSAADELVAKLIRRVIGGDIEGHYVIVQNLTDVLKENVQAALELRQLACVHQTQEGVMDLLGKVSAEVRETYELATAKGQLTARDIAEETGKSIAASSNRLARLQSLGLLVWMGNEAIEAGGRQNIYVPLR